MGVDAAVEVRAKVVAQYQADEGRHAPRPDPESGCTNDHMVPATSGTLALLQVTSHCGLYEHN